MVFGIGQMDATADTLTIEDKSENIIKVIDLSGNAGKGGQRCINRVIFARLNGSFARELSKGTLFDFSDSDTLK